LDAGDVWELPMGIQQVTAGLEEATAKASVASGLEEEQGLFFNVGNHQIVQIN